MVTDYDDKELLHVIAYPYCIRYGRRCSEYYNYCSGCRSEPLDSARSRSRLHHTEYVSTPFC